MLYKKAVDSIKTRPKYSLKTIQGIKSFSNGNRRSVTIERSTAINHVPAQSSKRKILLTPQRSRKPMKLPYALNIT